MVAAADAADGRGGGLHDSADNHAVGKDVIIISLHSPDRREAPRV